MPRESISDRSKHIEVQDLFIRQAVKDKLVKVTYLETDQMPADIFTKPLGPTKFLKFRDILGIVNLQ